MDEHSTRADAHHDREGRRGEEQDRELAETLYSEACSISVDIEDVLEGEHKDAMETHETADQWRALLKAIDDLANAEERIWRR